LPVNRGILSTIYITLSQDVPAQQVYEVYRQTYAEEPFVRVLPLGTVATLRHSQFTNLCVIGLTPVDTRRWIITSSIDNLVKGASGQAIQNMNIMLGMPETLGLTSAG